MFLTGHKGSTLLISQLICKIIDKLIRGYLTLHLLLINNLNHLLASLCSVHIHVLLIAIKYTIIVIVENLQFISKWKVYLQFVRSGRYKFRISNSSWLVMLWSLLNLFWILIITIIDWHEVIASVFFKFFSWNRYISTAWRSIQLSLGLNFLWWICNTNRIMIITVIQF